MNFTDSISESASIASVYTWILIHKLESMTTVSGGKKIPGKVPNILDSAGMFDI